MVDDGPLVRGALMQDQLRFAEAHPEADALLEALGEENIALIRSVSRVGWLPGDVNFDMVKAVVGCLGLEGGRRFYYDTFSEAWDTPLFRTLIRGSMRVTGADPGALVALVPRGTALIFRGFGEYELLSREPGQAVLARVDTAPRCFALGGAWLHFEAESHRSGIALTGHDARVDVELDEPRRRAVFHHRW